MADKQKKQMPKGGRKGGTVFPRLDLLRALEYAGKLVSKTHTGPQSQSIVLVGVFGTAGSNGLIRSSALKQYGLLESTDKGIQASSLARAIEAAPAEEQSAHIQKAFLLPRVFRALYDTFHGDTVTRAKLRQQALSLKVHPEAADECIEHFVLSLAAAKLGQESAEGVSLSGAARATGSTSALPVSDGEPPPHDDGVPKSHEVLLVDEHASQPSSEDRSDAPGQVAPRAVFHVNVTLDSSLDTEKLEKQLQLLRRYGAL
jgi:hypothetical protein